MLRKCLGNVRGEGEGEFNGCLSVRAGGDGWAGASSANQVLEVKLRRKYQVNIEFAKKENLHKEIHDS